MKLLTVETKVYNFMLQGNKTYLLIIGQFFEVLNSTYKKLRVEYYSKEENDQPITI